MERMAKRIATGLLTAWMLLTAGMAAADGRSGEGPDFTCEIMPLALPAEQLASASIGQQWEQVPLGPAPGHIGWLSWDGNYSLEALAQALAPPGTAERYRDPQNPSNTKFQTGSWLGGLPGVRNALSIRRAMDNLTGRKIRVPIYDTTRGSGGGLDYRLDKFVWVVPQAYSLAGQAWLSFRYEGEAPCRENKAPAITSQPLMTATTGQVYRYDITADDPDFDVGDSIYYSVQLGPDGMDVLPESGELSWLVQQDWQGNHRWPNDYCLASGGSGEQDGSADVVMVVDESGSMGGEHAWLKDMALPLESHLKANGIGVGEVANRYGLVGYEARPRPVLLDGKKMGDWEALREAAESLRLYGGREDGWRAIRYAMTAYPLRDDAAKNIILITDEGRDITDAGISYSSLLAELQDNKAILNAVVNARFVCTDENQQEIRALGMNADGVGYLADGNGGYLTCDNARATWGHKNTTNTLDVYVALALDSGGAAWDLTYLRAGGARAQSFTAALIDIKVSEIRQQLPPLPMPDLYISSIMETDSGVDIVVGNRGLSDVTDKVQVTLHGGTDKPSMQELPALLSGEHQTLHFPRPSPVSDVLVATVSSDSGQECLDENNTLRIPWVTVRAEDWNGLYDEQRFTLDILTPNRPPYIDSEPVVSASAGAVYTYDVNASDPDSGDSLQYALVTAPAGMEIDQVTGEVRYKPDAGQIGEHEVAVRVVDLMGAASEQVFTLTVNQDYTLPRIVSTYPLRAVQGLLYSYRLQLEHDARAELDFSVVLGPEGMVIDRQGVVTWDVPDNFAGKTAEAVLLVRDQFGNYALQFLTLRGAASNASPNIESQPPAWVELEQTYQYNIQASDPDGDPLHYRLIEGPADMQLDSNTGALQWQPQSTAQTSVEAVVQVHDPYGAFAEQRLNITVYDGPNYPPTFESEPEGIAWVGQSYSYQVSLSDPNGDPLEVTLQGLPDGAQWDAATYTLSWTPTVADVGEYSIVIEAVDPRGGTATQSFSLTVEVPNYPPVFESTPPSTVEVGETYRYTALATDPNGDALTYDLVQSPSGVLFNGVTGELTWSPSTGGNYTFIISVADGRGGNAQQTFSVEVTVPPSLCHAPYAAD